MAKPDGQKYLYGCCDVLVLALALHARFGWPLALVEGVRADPDDDREQIAEPCHAVAVPSEGVFADAAGLRTEAALFRWAVFAVRPTAVRIRPVTPEECAETFTSEPLDAAALAEAVDWVGSHVALWPVVRDVACDF